MSEKEATLEYIKKNGGKLYLYQNYQYVYVRQYKCGEKYLRCSRYRAEKCKAGITVKFRRMCILFIYNGVHDRHSEYNMILISNRDEYYDRASQNMAVWAGEPVVIGGRDLDADGGGTWLAVSPTFMKLGVLLNLPGLPKENAKTRGKIVADYVKSNQPVQNYVNTFKDYTKDCNEFVFVSVEFDKSIPAIFTYNNVNNQLKSHTETYHGFGNNLPEAPLKKVDAGRTKLQDICEKFCKESQEKELIEHLLLLLKSEERHLPDQQLETRRPNIYQELSSIYVCIPKGRYGTRTHTIVLLTKKGRLSITEITQQMPIDITNPKWEKTEFNFDMLYNKSKC